MLYNNPVSYGTDFLPEQIAELAAEHANLVAVKESTSDVRRVTAIRALSGDRLQIFVGVDDAIVEGIAAGAVGWVAGLVNAYPAESVALFDAARARQMGAGFRALSLVPASASHGYRAEVHPTDQAGAAGDGYRMRAGASSSAGNRGPGVGGDPQGREASAAKPA